MRHHVESPRRRGFILRRAALALALLGLSACGQYRSKFGESCTVYSASGESCAAGLECSCRTEGCVCVLPCGSVDAGETGPCPSGTVCRVGRDPSVNSSAYYCFPAPDGGV